MIDAQERIARHGLAWRGAFHPAPEDDVPTLPGGAAAGTVILLGFAGGVGWPAFAASAEAHDGAADPLDRWSRRVIDLLAREWGGVALYPFGGPPWLPFQRWARRADSVFASPLGILIHPRFGLWHSYRGAVSLRERLDLPPRGPAVSPCESCAGRPCLSACPVAAFGPDCDGAVGYDVPRCAAHVAAPADADCLAAGCAARRACPVGAGHAYGPAEAEFYMRSFLAARS
jgi:hypothetical protein